MNAMKNVINKNDENYDSIDDFIVNKLKITFSKQEKYRFIIGESPYPNAKNVITPFSQSTYHSEKIPEIAFLSKNYTADMFLVCGILFNSLDNAAQFIEWLLPQGTSKIAEFGEYLFINHRIVMFNRYGLSRGLKLYRDKLVIQLFKKYAPSNVLVIGKKTTKKFDKLVNAIECRVIHPNAKNALLHAHDWCETYFCRRDSNSNNKSRLIDFKL